jgi:MoxR-like ATPase
VNNDATSQPQASQTDDDIALAHELKQKYERVRAELGKVILGQEEVVDLVLLTLLVGGNSLIVGVPGLAKTLLIHTVAQVLDLQFSRIQFTPDLMPSDITGTDLVQEDPKSGRRELVFLPGPVFANIVLADEINRTPPKTQAALLEAMQEHRVTVQGKTYELKEPFFVFATQNPIELEGTYPLPEAQLDRFMFEIVMDYLPEDDELAVIRATTAAQDHALKRVVSGEEIRAYQQLVRRVPVSEPVLRYVSALVRVSRPTTEGAPEFITKWVAYGASVRAAQYLVLGGKARALTRGRYHVNLEDIQALAHSVLRHRILRNFRAESERIGPERVIDDLLAAVPPPSSGL